MRTSPRLAVPLFVIGLLALGACAGTAPPAAAPAPAPTAFPLTVTSCGRDVTFEQPPASVLTIGSVAAPLVAAAGASDKIILRTFETASFPGQYGPALSGVPLITPAKQELSREEIVARDPDLVISYEGAKNSPADLEAAGIKLLVNKGYCAEAKGDFEDIFADIELYGRLLGTPDAASAEVSTLRGRVAAVADQAENNPGRRAAALIFARDGGVLNAYGDTSTVDKQMDVLGLTNVFDDVAKRSFEANIEDLIARDPEVIILLTQGDQTPESVRGLLTARTELSSIAAVRNGTVVVLPFGYTGPSPVAVEGLEVMARDLAAPRPAAG